jgi:PPOX class probable F420-dependent enzyme
MAASTPLDGERYVSVESFRKDGSGVKTPVWAAPLDGKLVVVSAGDSYKVKRIRRDPKVRVAACASRGEVRGPWHDGTGRILDDPEQIRRAHAALRAKYGWQMLLLDLGAWIGRRLKRRAWLEISLTGSV